jgi:hypothetical protein
MAARPFWIASSPFGLLAMTSSRKPRLTREDYAARFKAERARQQQRYCDAFGLWRRCANRRCRRESGCRGDAYACLKSVLAAVPHHTQWQARQDMLEGMPQNIGAPERAARQCMPLDFYGESVAQAVDDYFARFEPKRPPRAR